MNVNFGGAEGVPLEELDLGGGPPAGLALGGPDSVVITTGDTFSVAVEGSAAATERMRFVLDEHTLAIGRESGDWGDSDVATVIITMPAPDSIAIGGSGRVTTDGLASDAELIVGGSGEVVASGIDGDRLEVVLGGSGRVRASGAAERMNLTIGGSGTADMAELQVGDAEVNIGGSGNATFASDGTVEANVAGSGTVRVRGSAECTINSVGSGSLICEPAGPAGDAASEGGPA
ncbi:MAG: DUF2807 domain-containing protein [Erythrobacter sp.]|nr:MAG: DUF2807 domain-containing protein [Erythrobacter sp.]